MKITNKTAVDELEADELAPSNPGEKQTPAKTTSITDNPQNPENSETENSDAKNSGTRLAVGELPSPDSIEKAVTAFRLATFSWNLQTNKVFYGGALDHLLQGQHPADNDDIRALLDLVHPEDYSLIYVAFTDLMRGRTLKLEREIRVKIDADDQNDTRDRWVLIRAEAIREDNTPPEIKPLEMKPLEIQGAVLDITPYKTTERQIAEITHKDMMTGLPNRQQVLTKIEQNQRDNLRRSRARKMDIAILDIAQFRIINENLGDTAGDKVLRMVGERLHHQLNRGDFLGRLAGDQFAFVILSSPQTDDSKISERLEKILRAASEPIILSDSLYRDDPVIPEFNIGLRRSMTSENVSAENLLSDAFLALREAKSNRNLNIAEFNHKIYEELLSSAHFKKIIRNALLENYLEVYYQPIIEYVSRKVTGFEALARINHPKEGLLLPNAFIPVAEESGLIGKLTHMVISEALKQLASWRKNNPKMRHMTMSINLSPVQFEDDQILVDLKAGLAKAGLEGKDIKIEVTERLFITNTHESARIINAIKKMGVQICIDDFGTGYSSLSYLRHYNFNTLKIDRSFILNITRESRDLELVRSIIQIGQNIGMSVVVEGVEEEDQYNLLKELGCQFVQGFLISQPLPAPQIYDWLKENNHI